MIDGETGLLVSPADTTALTEAMNSRSQEISDSLLETGSQLAENIATRADEVNNSLKSTGESLVLDLTLRGTDVVSKLEETGSRITETIVTRTSKVTESFRGTADNLASEINAKGDSVKDMLASRLQAFPILERLEPRLLEELSASFVTERHPEGRLVIQQGDPGDGVRHRQGEVDDRLDQAGHREPV